MADGAQKRVPQLVAGVDVRSLPLGPLEGFVLSRIDGALSVADLASLTGLGDEAVSDIVARLVELGAVRVDGGPKTPPPSARSVAPPAETPPRGPTVRTQPMTQTIVRALYDPAELEEDVDLEMERRRQILDTFYRLEQVTYYELLGVPSDADKKVIRAAYFDLSKTFHPDTMFRKRLGTYKAKMEAVFRKLTEAYETLGKSRTRTAYDEYIQLTAITNGTQRELVEGEKFAKREAVRLGTPESGIPRSTALAEELAAGLPVPPAAPTPSPTTAAPATPPTPATTATPPPPAATATPKPPATPPPPAATATPKPPATPPPPAAAATAPPAASPSPPPAAPRDPDARRRQMQELIARRLQHVARRPAAEVTASTPPPPATSEDRRRDLARSLHSAASLTGGTDTIARQLATAKTAEREGKLVEATNALRLAMALAPDREDIAQEHDRVRFALAESLADTYEKQARYEESVEKWQAAALSWSRVAEGRPDSVEPHWRTAEALVKAGGDLHRARTAAQRAVDLAPADVRARVVLARVFFAAGLKLNAKREAEVAASLDPASDLVKNLLRDVK